MQKTISLLFAIYIVFLTLLPCADHEKSDNCNESNVSNESPNNHNHDTADQCSPFCHCSCCGTIMEIAKIYISTYFVTVPKTILFFYFIDSPKQIFFSIWIPPKI